MSAPRRLSTSTERRDEVLVAATAEFADRGLSGASTERVARAAGIAHSYVFKLFGTKRDLFLAVTDQVYDLIGQRFRTAAGTAVPGHVLDAMAATFADLLTERDQLRVLLHGFAASGDEYVARHIRGRYRDLLAEAGRLSGTEGERLRAFWAHGMLMMVLAAIDEPGPG